MYMWIFAFVVLIIPTVALLALKMFILPKRKEFNLNAKHAFITGGSKGIGKAIAIELIRRGANVTIVARDCASLEETCTELNTIIELKKTGQKAQWYPLDVTKSAEQTENLMRRAESELGPIDILINNVGRCVQGDFDQLPIESFEQQMQVNYFSAVYTTRAVIQGMKRRQNGRIAFVSSAAGQLGIFGYCAYSPTKFALRGFAEALQMELEPHNIAVTVLYPPNTETEGYKEESRTMPEEVRLIGETGGLFDPKQVAILLIDDIVAGNVATNIGMDGWMLGTLTSGGASETNLFAAAQQILFGGIFRAILLVYHRHFRSIVANCAQKKSR